MGGKIKRINIKEFRAKGYLQEVNRLFFHRLGLALEVIIDEATGEEKLGGIWDSRDDPEGFLFDKYDRGKATSVKKEMEGKVAYRAALPECDVAGIQIRLSRRGKK